MPHGRNKLLVLILIPGTEVCGSSKVKRVEVEGLRLEVNWGHEMKNLIMSHGEESGFYSK